MKKLIILVLVLAAGAVFFLGGRKAYHAWKQEHLIKQAERFIANSDTTNAILCLQQALQTNPSNVKACQTFAALAEKAGSRNAVYWRRHVVELEPKVTQYRVDWAKTALVMGDLESARQALLSVDEKERKSAEYFKALGSLAWGLNQWPEAETNFAQALRLEPTNPVSQMDLSIIRLVTEDGTKANLARASLEALRTNPVVRLDALRQLVHDAERNSLVHRAVDYARELQQDPKCRFDDRLLYLDMLLRANSPELEQSLKTLESMASTNSSSAYGVVGWMAAHNRTKEALAWAQSLSPSVQTNPPLPLVTAECFASVREWSSLDSLLVQQDWKDMDYLRHLLRSISLRAQGNGLSASVEWRSALKSAAKRLESLNDLARRSFSWHWDQELNETLWAIVDNFPNEKGAFLMLYDRLFEVGNTPGLHTLLAKVLEFVPSNQELKNNLALVSMLIDPQNPHAHDLAREVFDADSHNPSFVSTYAYSLYCQGKTDQAIRVLEGLQRNQLEEPTVAAYYAVILSGSGDHAKAQHYLSRARDARLLPEERNLLAKAER